MTENVAKSYVQSRVGKRKIKMGLNDAGRAGDASNIRGFSTYQRIIVDGLIL